MELQYQSVSHLTFNPVSGIYRAEKNKFVARSCMGGDPRQEYVINRSISCYYTVKGNEITISILKVPPSLDTILSVGT